MSRSVLKNTWGCFQLNPERSRGQGEVPGLLLGLLRVAKEAKEFLCLFKSILTFAEAKSTGTHCQTLLSIFSLFTFLSLHLPLQGAFWSRFRSGGKAVGFPPLGPRDPESRSQARTTWV